MAEDIIVNFLTKKNEAADAFDDIGDSAENASGKVEGTSTVMRGLKGAALFGAGAAAVAIAGIGVAAFTMSADTNAAAMQMSASLGIPMAKAEEFADVAQDVFKNNFGASVTEAAGVVELLAKQIDGLADDNNGLQAAAEDAFALKDVFDIDVADSVSAADTLMENFGLSSEEAFDLMTAGAQKGLNKSGDFLDTVEEYSTQFASGGATAEEFFQFLESGLAGGTLGTDKAADAFKEFSLKINEADDNTKAAIATILGTETAADDMFAAIADGSMTSTQAFKLVTAALGEAGGESVEVNNAIKVLGTQFEDLGSVAVSELSFVGNSFEDVTQASESLSVKYSSFGDLASGVSRRVIVAVSPLTDKLLEIANNAMPHVEAAFTVFENNIIPTIENAGQMIAWATDLVNRMFSGGEFSAGVERNLTILRTLSAWFDTNLPLMKQAVEVVTRAMGEFWTNHGENIMTVINNTFQVVTTVIDTALRVILDLITLVLAAITGDWRLFGDTLKNIATTVFSGITDVVSLQMSSFGAIFNSLFTGIPDVISQGFSTVTNAITLGARSVTSGVKTVFNSDSLRSAATTAIDGMTNGLNFAFDNLAPHALALAENLTSNIKRGFSEGGLRGAATAGLNGLVSGFNSKMDAFIPHVQAVLENLVAKFKEIFSWDALRGIGHLALDGLLVSFDDKWQAIKDKVTNLGNMLPESLRNILDINSPSRVMEKIRDDFLSPLENMSPRGVNLAAQNIAGGLTAPFAGAGQIGGQQSNDNSRSNTNIFQVTLQVTGDSAEQARQAIDDLAFRYNANLVGA